MSEEFLQQCCPKDVTPGISKTKSQQREHQVAKRQFELKEEARLAKRVKKSAKRDRGAWLERLTAMGNWGNIKADTTRLTTQQFCRAPHRASSCTLSCALMRVCSQSLRLRKQTLLNLWE